MRSLWDCKHFLCQCYKCTVCSWEILKASQPPAFCDAQSNKLKTAEWFSVWAPHHMQQQGCFKAYSFQTLWSCSKYLSNCFMSIRNKDIGLNLIKGTIWAWCTHRSLCDWGVLWVLLLCQHIRRKILMPCLILQEQKRDKLLLISAIKLIHWTKTGATLTSFSQTLCKYNVSVWQNTLWCVPQHVSFHTKLAH